MASIFESDSDDDKKRQQAKRRGGMGGVKGGGTRLPNSARHPAPQVDVDLTSSYGLTFDAAAAASRNDEQYLSALRAPAQPGQSAEGMGFARSIEEARRRREEEREDAIIRNLAKQREADLGDAELVEKDLSVGVFVTPQYKEHLHRRIKSRGDASLAAVASTLLTRNGNQKKYDDDSDDDEPLQSHIFAFDKKKIEVVADASVSHAMQNSTLLTDTGKNSDHTVSAQQSQSAPPVQVSRAPVACAEESRAKRRESRKGMVIDATIIAAARLRFLDREKKRQLEHLHFCSGK